VQSGYEKKKEENQSKLFLFFIIVRLITHFKLKIISSTGYLLYIATDRDADSCVRLFSYSFTSCRADRLQMMFLSFILIIQSSFI